MHHLGTFGISIPLAYPLTAPKAPVRGAQDTEPPSSHVPAKSLASPDVCLDSSLQTSIYLWRLLHGQSEVRQKATRMRPLSDELFHLLL